MRRLLARFRAWRWRRRWPLYVKGCWYCSGVDMHYEACPVPSQEMVHDSVHARARGNKGDGPESGVATGADHNTEKRSS